MASNEEKLYEMIKNEQGTVEDRPNFNINVPLNPELPEHTQEYKISDIVSEISDVDYRESKTNYNNKEGTPNKNSFQINDIIPFITKSINGIIKDLFDGRGIEAFLVEDRLIGILLLFSFFGMYHVYLQFN